MAFPSNPSDGDTYTTDLGTEYRYDSTDNKWYIITPINAFGMQRNLDMNQYRVLDLPDSPTAGQDAVNRNYVESITDPFLDYQGTWDASTGSYPNAGTGDNGKYYVCIKEGTIDGVEYNVGDWIAYVEDGNYWTHIKIYGTYARINISTGKNITSATSDVINAGGGEIFIEKGTHDTNTNYPITLDDGAGTTSLVITGMGDESVLKPGDGESVIDLHGEQMGYVLIRNLKIDCSNYTGHVNTIDILENNNNIVILENITFYDDGTNADFIDLNSDNTIVRNCRFINGHYQIEIDGGDNCRIYENEMDNSTHNFVIRSDATYNTIFDNHLDGASDDNIWIAGDNNKISENTIVNSGGYGIDIQSDADNNIFLMNHYSGNSSGKIHDRSSGDNIIFNATDLITKNSFDIDLVSDSSSFGITTNSASLNFANDSFGIETSSSSTLDLTDDMFKVVNNYGTLEFSSSNALKLNNGYGSLFLSQTSSFDGKIEDSGALELKVGNTKSFEQTWGSTEVLHWFDDVVYHDTAGKAYNIGTSARPFDEIYADNFNNQGPAYFERDLYEDYKKMELKPHNTAKTTADFAEIDLSEFPDEIVNKQRTIKKYDETDKEKRKRNKIKDPRTQTNQEMGVSINQWCLANTTVIKTLINKIEILEKKVAKLKK